MKVEKRIHKIYEEWENSGKSFTQLVDKYQYIYSSDKGEISCVKFLNYFKEGDDFWEIYCLKGDLFEDVERFRTKEEMEVRIKELL